MPLTGILSMNLASQPMLMPEKVSVFEFNKAIIDATSDLVCAYKLNFAFYEAMGDEGIDALRRSIKHIPGHIPVIGDAKRGDIGTTAARQAEAGCRVGEDYPRPIVDHGLQRVRALQLLGSV